MFKTLIIDSNCDLRYRNGHLICEKENECNEIFLDDVNTIIVNSLEVSLTTFLINEIKKKKINLVICDERRNPSLQVLSLYGSFNCANNLFEQINWTNYDKNKCWYYILTDKIIMQKKLLSYFNINDNGMFDTYFSQIESPDIYNVEGILAKIYFRCLFGKLFNRRDDSNINSALNYGYSILLSYINNLVVTYGYKTEIGVNHKSKTNEFNLSCDFIEPFRCFVDKCVKANGDIPLTKEYKIRLINVLYEKCIYNNKEMELRLAIKEYVNDKLTSIKNDYYQECVIEYV